MAIATLSIDVIARLGQLKTDMDRAGAVVEGAASKMKANFSTVTQVAKGVAAGLTAAFAAGGAIVAFIDNVNSGLLAIKDLSEATGASIENISSLENVARNAGGSIEDFSGILIKFNGALKDAERTKELGLAFKAIGLNVQELRQLDPADALFEVAKAFDKFRDDGNKARLMQEIFGRSVKDAIPFLKELAEQGKVNNTVTTEQVLAADKFNKEMAKLKNFAEDAARSIASALVPALNRLAERIRDKGIFQGLFGPNEVQVAIQASKAISDRITIVTNQIIGWQNIADKAEGKDARRARIAREKVAAYREELQKLTKELTATNEKLKEFGGADGSNYSNEGRNALIKPAIVVPVGEDKPKGSKASASRSSPGPQLDQATIDALRAIEQTDVSKVEALNAALDKLFEIRASGIGGDAAVDQAIERLRDELAKLDPAAQKAAANTARLESLLAGTNARKAATEYNDLQLAIEAIGKATDPQAIKELGELIDRLTGFPPDVSVAVEAATEEISEFAKQAAANIQDALGETLKRALKGDFDSIGDLWVDMLLTMATEAAAAKLNEFIFGDFLKGGGLGEGGQVIVDFFKGFGGFFATGGYLPAGKWGIAGERGPEPIMGPATILPNSALQGGGATYAPNIVVQGDVGPSTVSLVERMLARERVRWQRSQYARGLA